MPTTHSNGKVIPTPHLSADDLIARAIARRLVPFHWHILDMDVLLRPWSTQEVAERMEQEVRFTIAKARFEETHDEGDYVTFFEQVLYKLTATLPCILYPDDKTTVFGTEHAASLIEKFPTGDLMEIVQKVEEISNFTLAQSEEAAKNSVEIEDSKPSSISPETAVISE